MTGFIVGFAITIVCIAIVFLALWGLTKLFDKLVD